MIRGIVVMSFALLFSCAQGEFKSPGAITPGPTTPGGDPSDPSTPPSSPGPDPDPGTPNPGDPPPPSPPPPHCALGKTYTGFGGSNLNATRTDGDIGVDRSRVKPFAALAREYPRVLGNTPGLLSGADSTFGAVADRWFDEPEASAVSLYTAYRVAFQGCLTLTTSPAKYGTAPSNTTADAECTAWALSMWARAPTAAELAACHNVAMVDTAAETNARRRWAYTCAAVLSSAGFLTY